MRFKEIIIGIIVALLVIVGFFFRGKFFRSALRTDQKDQELTQPAEQSKLGNDQIIASSTGSMQNEKKFAVPVKIPSVPVSSYFGRPLVEVRFSPDALSSMSAERRNQFSVDIAKYAKMTMESPEYAAAWLQLAILKKTIGDYEGARDLWIYLTAARPKEATAFLNLGDLYTNYLKDYPKAEKSYQGAIKAEPKNAMGYLGLSDLYVFFYKEKAAQAEAVLKEGIAANPDDVNLQKALARLHERNVK